MAWQIGNSTTTANAPVGAINLQASSVGNVGIGEDTLHTYTMPANTLVETGRGLYIRATGQAANNANTKTYKLKFGSQIISVAIPTSVASDFTVEAWIVRTGLDAQYYFVELRDTTSAGVFSSFMAQGNLTEPETSNIIITSTGEATANNDITEVSFIVSYF